MYELKDIIRHLRILEIPGNNQLVSKMDYDSIIVIDNETRSTNYSLIDICSTKNCNSYLVRNVILEHRLEKYGPDIMLNISTVNNEDCIIRIDGNDIPSYYFTEKYPLLNILCPYNNIKISDSYGGKMLSKYKADVIYLGTGIRSDINSMTECKVNAFDNEKGLYLKYENGCVKLV